MLLVLRDRVLDHLGINISEIGLGVDRCKNDSVNSFDVVNDTIATTFAFLDIAVFETDFEHGVVYSRDAIARKLTRLKLLDQGLKI